LDLFVFPSSWLFSPLFSFLVLSPSTLALIIVIIIESEKEEKKKEDLLHGASPSGCRCSDPWGRSGRSSFSYNMTDAIYKLRH
jgi:hypothetical protein